MYVSYDTFVYALSSLPELKRTEEEGTTLDYTTNDGLKIISTLWIF